MEKYNESLRLILAVKDGRLKDVISCLDKGAEINCQDEVEDYPIHIAAAKGYMEIVRLLLDQGSDCNLKARYTENSPLHLAAEGGYVKTTELLLMRGGDPSIKNWKGESPLHRPALDGHLDVVTLLLNAGSDSNIATKRLNGRDVCHPFDSTPLHYAVESGKLNTVSLFVERASDLSWMNIYKALNLAAEYRQLDLLRVLLISGCDPKIKNDLGETPFDKFKGLYSYSVENSELDLSVSKLLELIQENERKKQAEERILEELRGLGLETTSDLLEVIKLGHYKCYWNRVYLVGPYFSGKSCLAKILVGEPVPKGRQSTDGIWIYMGRAGMDIEEKMWKCFPKGDAIKEVLTSMLMSISKPENTETPVSHSDTSQTDLTKGSTIERPKKHVTKADVHFKDKTIYMNPKKSFDTPTLKSNMLPFHNDKYNISAFPCNTSNWQDNQPFKSPVENHSTGHEGYVASKANKRKDSEGLQVDNNASNVLNNEKNDFGGLTEDCKASVSLKNERDGFGELPVKRNAVHVVDNVSNDFEGIPVHNTSDVLNHERNDDGVLSVKPNASHIVDNAQMDFGGLTVDCIASHVVDNEPKEYRGLPVDISASHMQVVDKEPNNFGGLSFDSNASHVVGNARMDFRGSSVDCSASHVVDNDPKEYARLPVDTSAPHMQAVDTKPNNIGGLPFDSSASHVIDNARMDFGGSSVDCSASHVLENEPKEYAILPVDTSVPHMQAVDKEPNNFGGLQFDLNATHVVDNAQMDIGELSVDCSASHVVDNEPKEYGGLPVDISASKMQAVDKEPNNHDNFGGLPFDCNASHVIDNAQMDIGGLSVDCSASHVVDNEPKEYGGLPVDFRAPHVQAVDREPNNFGGLPFDCNFSNHSNEETIFDTSSNKLLKESNIVNLDINVQDSSATEKHMLVVPEAVKGSFIGVPTSASSLSTATFKNIIHVSNNDPNDPREAPVNHIDSTEERRLSSSSNTSELVQYKEKLMEKITSELSHKNIHQLVIQAIADGKYKQTVIPIDIWDFGGQKDYYMTHQLFITSRGIFILIFNGSLGLHKTRRDLSFLPGHFGKPTVAVYLIHWVNSILTYSKRLDKGFPRILFVATHKDKISENKLESHRNKLMDQIEDLFKSHAGRSHLEFRPLLFVNALNKNDPEIETLRILLMKRAVEHPQWGELRPTAWVPLELQLLMEVENGISIMSKTQLKMMNSQNEPMVLTEKQLETFLRVQHSLGKLLYFNTTILRNYVIIKPAYLVEVLRSIVTEKQFWIKEKRFYRVLQTLRDTGCIDRLDIYSIWSQSAFNQILPYKEFMIEVLVHLDVLVAPQTENENIHRNIQHVSRFLVPCMITRPNKTKYMNKFCTSKTSIVMSYTFIEEVIPPALTYRFLGSFVTMWGVKNYKGKKRMLFSDLAVVEVDKSHDVAVQVVKNRVVVYLIHSERKADIVPTLASSVKECLTAAVYRISEFYSTLSEESNTVQQKSHIIMPFVIEFGVHFEKTVCFFPTKTMPRSIQDRGRWCNCHKQSHDVSFLRLWFSEKISCDRCDESCKGLGEIEIEQCPEEKHLLRLVARLTHLHCRELFIAHEMETSIWEDILQQFLHLHPDDSKFTSLIRWKEGRRNPTFQDILYALEKCHLDKHLLCQVFRDVVPDTSGIPAETLTKVPSTSTLQCIENHIGYSSMQLGVELGLTMSEIQNIQYEYQNKPLDQTRVILRIWQQKKAPRSTNLSLIKALHRIGKSNCINMIR